MGHLQSFEDFLVFLRQRGLLIATLAALIIIAMAWFIRGLPDSYLATASIQVEAPVLEGGQSSQEQTVAMLQSIENQLTMRENLLAVAERHALFVEYPDITDDDIVSALRQSIQFELVTGRASAVTSQRSISAILIRVELSDGEVVARVANDVAQSVVDLASETALTRSSATLQFFRDEESRLTADIVAKNAEISAMIEANKDALPEVAAVRREEQARLEGELLELDQAVIERETERTSLEALRQLREVDRRRLTEIDAELNLLEQRKASLTPRLELITATLDRVPAIEARLGVLRRDLELLEGRYDSVAGDLADAETAAKLVDNGQDQTFAVLDRAVDPVSSLGPAGRKLLGAGSILALAAACVMAFLIDMIRVPLRTSLQMERELGLAPLIALPEVGGLGMTTEARRAQMVRAGLMVAGLALVVLIASVGIG
jgi:tyrosine-protein kinase Etk/Wzc